MPFFDFPRDRAFFADFLESIRRGTGMILYENEHAILLRESDWLHMLYADSPEAAEPMLPLLPQGALELIVHGDSLSSFICQRLELTDLMRFVHVLYEKPEPPRVAGDLEIRHPANDDFPTVAAAYHTVPVDVLRQNFERDDFLGGYINGELVGFIGVHAEGVMGMLHVFPQYRRRGYAEQLLGRLIAVQMQAGRIPYGQVETDNTASLALQRKLGLTFAADNCHWLCREQQKER